LALAVGSSIMYVPKSTDPLVLSLITETSNNSLLSAARATTVPANVMHRITKDPTLLMQSSALNITATERADILAGYLHGFRLMFTMNALMAAAAAVVAYVMIEHKELARSDDEDRQKEAQAQEMAKRVKGGEKGSVTRIELGAVSEMEVNVGLGRGLGKGNGKGVEKGTVVQFEKVVRKQHVRRSPLDGS
jgi:hypothetical protein